MKGSRMVLALGAVVALVAPAGCGSSKTHGEERTLTLTEPGGESGKTFGVIGKASAKGIEPGSGFAFYSPLEDSSGKTVGEIKQPISGKEIGNNISGAIVGATGKYAGAVGAFSSKAIEKGENSPED